MTAFDKRATEARAIAGDPATFGALIRTHDPGLRRLAWSMLRDPHAIDDVMQTTYEKAFASIESFDGRSEFATWLHAICYRAALDHIRYESRRQHDDIDDLALTATTPTVSDSAMTREELRTVLADMDPVVRAMLLLTAGLGYSFDEVAKITGEKRGTVASRISRARQKIERW